ncbi:MAG: hypothetical protein LBC96_06870 [Lachnospiraceae bacterium]|jgi:hypothetical protein|nr:hypothetical protein [Lachnospiraceae bacterium]
MTNNLTEARCIPPSEEYLNNKRSYFQKILHEFANYVSIDKSRIKVDNKLLDDVIVRLHQRLNYYLFFHGKNLEQSRQAAIYAYWILRYRPLRVLVWDKAYDVNIYFAFYTLFAVALFQTLSSCPKEYQVDIVMNIRKEYESDFLRSFNEYDISKESMMMISDSIKSIFKAEIKRIQS